MTSASPNTPDIEPDRVNTAAAVAGDGGQTPFFPSVPAYPERSGLGAELPGGGAGAETPRHRLGECAPTVPDIQPDFVKGLAIVREAPGSRPAGAGEPCPEKPPPPLLRLGHWTVALAALSFFGFLLFSQALSALALVQSLPEWARWLFLAPMSLCVLVMLFLAADLSISWFRLRTLAQVDLAELERRSASGQGGTGDARAARIAMEDYLADYPLDEGRRRRPLEAGLAPETLAEMARERDWLFRRKTDSLSWLDDFRAHFQARMDGAARTRINSWSRKAGLCAMASPIPLLDAILVLSVCLRMLRDVAAIYNVRCGRLAALALFQKTVFAAFLAGAVGSVGGAAEEGLSELAGEAGLGVFLGGVAGLVGAKLAEGTANAVFVLRLGRKAQELLRPLRPQP